MTVHSRFGRTLVRGVLALSLAAGPLMIAGVAVAQDAPAAPVALNAPPANMSAHEAAVDAAHRRDYIAAADFAKKAASAGQPLDADQLDFITAQAAKQQATADADAKLKASQIAAAGTAQQILDRQQAEYAKNAKKQGGGASDKAACMQAEGGQVQTATDVYANGFSRSSGGSGQTAAMTGKKCG